jgi:hypothetical protein
MIRPRQEKIPSSVPTLQIEYYCIFVCPVNKTGTGYDNKTMAILGDMFH